MALAAAVSGLGVVTIEKPLLLSHLLNQCQSDGLFT